MEQVNIRPFLPLIALPMEAAATVGAEHFPLKDVRGIRVNLMCLAFFAHLPAVCLYCLKNFMADNGLMGIGGDNQVILVCLYLLVVHNFCLALHQITGINFTVQYLCNRAGLPFAGADQVFMGDLARGTFPVAGRLYALFVQPAGNIIQPYMLISPLENTTSAASGSMSSLWQFSGSFR